ncbi:MAG: glutamate--tRNA ligase [Candidatus Melainabacteria bacterium]|nr:glutamate--tRNA ligase [Candidatus Melainabacteria bacterium]
MIATPTNPSVRVRIAPSPTGNLHVGTARTALFNYLFAKHHNGTFILRVEDTDTERSNAAFTQNIFDGLRGLGLDWHEGPDVGGNFGPYTQSDRLELYKKYAHQLLDQGLAYYDYNTPDLLDAMREEATAKKLPFVYRPAPLTPEQEAEAKATATQPPSIRFRIPRDRTQIVVQDLVRGTVTFDANLLGDIVLLKSDGIAAYNFAVVVDDALMKISHVIRGEDHLPNTPKQQVLYEALGWEIPQFAHLGMILAPDRSKLSKRHGATAVSAFVEDQGYLPEAFINFLALLGWSPASTEEIFTIEQLAEQFSLDRVAHSGAIFDVEKLKWVNGQYIRSMPIETLAERVAPYLTACPVAETYTTEQWHLLLDAVKEPLVVLSDVTDAVSYFFGDDVAIPAELAAETIETEEGKRVLQVALEEWLPNHADFSTLDETYATLKILTKTLLKDLKVKTVMWAIRAAVSGRVQGADLGKTLFLLGKEKVGHRLAQARK